MLPTLSENNLRAACQMSLDLKNGFESLAYREERFARNDDAIKP